MPIARHTQAMSDATRLRFGAADDRAGELSLADRFRRHADALVRLQRSPLSARLMNAAAADLDAGGVVSRLFASVPAPPGSVPQLRLLAALHHLVLSGRAHQLAAFYPSAGGERTVRLAEAWPAAVATLEEHFAWIGQRLHRIVQTNEPGRAAVLFGALVWLTDRRRLPISLLEIGASAGLNLLADRYCYVVGGEALGDPFSPVHFEEPWRPGPALDASAASRRLQIVRRAGCDLSPLDPGDPEDRLTLLSYIWPDEPERIDRMKAALALAARWPAPVATQPASEWLPAALAGRRSGELTVIWQSILRQYLGREEWGAIEHSFRRAAEAGPPVAWLSMEPSDSDDHLARVSLTLRTHPGEPQRRLAWCGDHGPPVLWDRSAAQATDWEQSERT